MQVSALLDWHQLYDHFVRRYDPTEPQTWGQRLREGTEIKDIAGRIAIVSADVLPIKCDQRCQVIAFVTKLAVRIVFYDRDSVPLPSDTNS